SALSWNICLPIGVAPFVLIGYSLRLYTVLEAKSHQTVFSGTGALGERKHHVSETPRGFHT
ncbi:MAG: hypothetical protein RR505_15165, partial [Raoultibacter sp.]